MNARPDPDDFREVGERLAELREQIALKWNVNSPEFQEMLAREIAAINEMGESEDEKAWVEAAAAQMASWDDWTA